MARMKFAKIIFAIAGVWGIVVLIPLYFMRETLERMYPPPVSHPDFYYGFISVALAWQVAFLIIAADPVRLRPMMVAAILEKFGYVTTLLVLSASGQLQMGQAAVGVPDLLLGVFFVAAWLKTRPASEGSWV